MILYHVTTDESLDSILKEGLKPLIGQRSEKNRIMSCGVFIPFY